MLLLLCLGLLPSLFAQDKLLLSQAIFRHSARAPTSGFSSDQAKAYFYRGLGEITDDGLQLAQDLGKALRARLVDSGFIDKRYIPSESYFRSSGSGRCIVTSNAVASGLFDPVNSSLHNAIIVQTMPQQDDWLCVPQTTDWLLEQMFVAAGLQYNNQSTLGDLYDYLLSNWAANSTLIQHMTSAYMIDALPIEKDAGLPVPSWFDEQAEAEDLFYLNKYNTFYTGTGEYQHPEWIRCRSGLLLYTVMSNIQNKIACGSNCTTPKFYAYATHDYMIQSLLDSFGIIEDTLHGQIPPFTGTILVELWQSGVNQFIKLLWRSPGSSFISLTSKVRNCTSLENCPVANFTSCCSQYSSPDPQAECTRPVSYSPNYGPAILAVYVIFSELFLQ